MNKQVNKPSKMRLHLIIGRSTVGKLKWTDKCHCPNITKLIFG